MELVVELRREGSKTDGISMLIDLSAYPKGIHYKNRRKDGAWLPMPHRETHPAYLMAIEDRSPAMACNGPGRRMFANSGGTGSLKQDPPMFSWSGTDVMVSGTSRPSAYRKRPLHHPLQATAQPCRDPL